MNAREYEQEHVQQTSALIQQEIAFLDSQKKETKSKFDTDMLENADQRIQGGSFEALAFTLSNIRFTRKTSKSVEIDGRKSLFRAHRF